MSVLFKALQKAEKENEQRQTISGGTHFDAGRIAGSGAIKLAPNRSISWRTVGLSAAVVLAVAIAGAFFLVDTSHQTSGPAQVAAVPPAKPGTTETIPVMQPPPGAPGSAPAQVPASETPVATAPAAPAPDMQSVAVPAAAPAQPAPAPAAPAPTVQTATAVPQTPPAPVAAPPVEEAPAVAPVEPAKQPPKAVAKAAPAAAEPPVRKKAMPDIAVDSPARALSPPIAIQRAEFELAGIGSAVQVREVSKSARDNVSAGYEALIRGSYDSALGFYERALQDEPNSLLALLGRGAALQKMKRNEEAVAAYEKVLKIDPVNKEALSNLTVITADRSPNDAVMKLQELERQYPSFSPIKAQIGLTYAKAGRMPEALDYLRRAAALSPESVMYQYNMALVLDHMGQRDGAVAAYETVLASLSGGRSSAELSATEIERRVRYLRAR